MIKLRNRINKKYKEVRKFRTYEVTGTEVYKYENLVLVITKLQASKRPGAIVTLVGPGIERTGYIGGDEILFEDIWNSVGVTVNENLSYENVLKAISQLLK